ncbi:hypothetical protein LZ32DRAFT_411176 [Colletotrichum eremochloae]|nr:hypothetical protein LZ32DRAFT_411176 [Colletotrichum eremochloae]
MRTHSGLCCMHASGTKFARPVTGSLFFFFFLVVAFRCVALQAGSTFAWCATEREKGRAGKKKEKERKKQYPILRYVLLKDKYE